METASYRERIRQDNGQVLDSTEPRICGACGLSFLEVASAGRDDHPLHGACPRCGEQTDIGDRTG